MIMVLYPIFDDIILIRVHKLKKHKAYTSTFKTYYRYYCTKKACNIRTECKKQLVAYKLKHKNIPTLKRHNSMDSIMEGI